LVCLTTFRAERAERDQIEERQSWGADQDGSEPCATSGWGKGSSRASKTFRSDPSMGRTRERQGSPACPIPDSHHQGKKRGFASEKKRMRQGYAERVDRKGLVNNKTPLRVMGDLIENQFYTLRPQRYRQVGRERLAKRAYWLIGRTRLQSPRENESNQ